MGTGISEASKRVPIFSFDTQGGKQASSYSTTPRNGNPVNGNHLYQSSVPHRKMETLLLGSCVTWCWGLRVWQFTVYKHSYVRACMHIPCIHTQIATKHHRQGQAIPWPLFQWYTHTHTHLHKYPRLSRLWLQYIYIYIYIYTATSATTCRTNLMLLCFA